MSFMDKAVAQMAAYTQPIDVGRVVRRTIYNIGVVALLVIAATRLDGWIVWALLTVAALRVYPYLYFGSVERVRQEKDARLAVMPPNIQRLLNDTTNLYGSRR